MINSWSKPGTHRNSCGRKQVFKIRRSLFVSSSTTFFVSFRIFVKNYWGLLLWLINRKARITPRGVMSANKNLTSAWPTCCVLIGQLGWKEAITEGCDENLLTINLKWQRTSCQRLNIFPNTLQRQQQFSVIRHSWRNWFIQFFLLEHRLTCNSDFEVGQEKNLPHT